MSALFEILAFLVTLYMVVLVGRVVFDLVQAFSRSWRPEGFVLVIANVVYSLTDPPVRTLRRIIPPLRLGAVALDLGFLVLFLGLSFLRSLLLAAARL
ncbi:MAG: YggT family protein [Actinomycetales bacterium]|nr:YggT family protein [Actinomycetales bacterium]